MNRTTLCLVFLTLVAHSLAQACKGTVVAVEQPAEWEENNIPKHIFELHVTNNDATCTMRDSLQLSITLPAGSHLGHSWGMTPAGVTTIPAIAPGQTYAGVGFVYSGAGQPQVSITSVGTCDCGTSSANPSTGTPTSSPATGTPSSTTGGVSTDAPTSAPTPTNPPTDTPTSSPTSSPTSTPTTVPTAAPTSSPTSSPTLPPTSLHVNMRYLVLSKDYKSGQGLEIVNLTFNSVGSQFDVVPVAATTDLTPYLSTSGVGLYAGIVIIKSSFLTAAQMQLVTAYQTHYGVKSAILNSSPAGLPGMTDGASSAVKGTLTLAPEGYSIANPLQHDISVDTQKATAWNTDNPATITPATITDSTVATPIVYYNGNEVVVATVSVNGTKQLHYFITQSGTLFFARIFTPILLNWLSPGGVYLGLRRHTLAVQPDDLFLASNLWDPATHKNPLSNNLVYRITADDLQKTADYLNSVNPTLPTGSYVTIEWPYNGAGTTWYTQPDALLAKAISLQNVFYFVSHTWDHPCDFDTANYTEVFNELKNNIDWVNTGAFLTGNMNSPHVTKNALVNPCITGLFNGQCLQAMADNGIQMCVGDNSVKALVPDNLYHGIHTTVATHGYAGMFIIPREAYDIDYDNSIPAELVDQFNTQNKKLSYTFEQIMDLQVDYAMEKKSAFRQDAFMFHQANLRFFSYDDPVAGITHDVSLTTLWMDRVIKQTLAYYNLPIVSPQFPAMAQIWLDREALDNCGFNADLSISNGQLYTITLSTSSDCTVPLSGVQLSGSTVTVETAGAEVTSYITMTAGVSQTFTLPTPVNV